MPFPSSASTNSPRPYIAPIATCSSITFRADWITEAASLTGRCLHTALALSYLASKQQLAGVKMTRRTMAQFSISREAFYDAIRKLEAKKLIKVWRLPGRCLHVILTEPGGDKPLDLSQAIRLH